VWQSNVAELGRHLGDRHPFDEPFAPAPVLDQVGDAAHLDAVLLAEDLEVGHAGHLAVVLDDLADHAGGAQAGQPAQVDDALGLAGAHQHAAFARAQREDVAGAGQILGLGVGIGRRQDRAARSLAEMPVDTPSVASMLTVNAVPKRDLFSCTCIGSCSWSQIAGSRARQTRPRASRIIRLTSSGDANCGGEAEVALVLAVGVVDQHDRAAGLEFFEQLGDGYERHVRVWAAPRGAAQSSRRRRHQPTAEHRNDPQPSAASISSRPSSSPRRQTRHPTMPPTTQVLCRTGVVFLFSTAARRSPKRGAATGRTARNREEEQRG
jgi:hypothetical protein